MWLLALHSTRHCPSGGCPVKVEAAPARAASAAASAPVAPLVQRAAPRSLTK